MKDTIAREAPSPIRDVDGTSFRELVLRGSGAIVVEFMSYGCAHCRALEPVLEEVARSLASQESFFRVNVALDLELANDFRITGTPTLVFFRDGDEVGRVEGPAPTTSLIRKSVTQSFAP